MRTNILSLKLFIVYILGACCVGCNFINPAEKVPTYVHIDSFQFVPSAQYPSYTSHSITSAIVYYNNSTVGIFDLPCTVPIQTDAQSSTGRLEIAPCINVNGLNNSIFDYSFYTIDTSTFTIQPGKIFTRQPHTSFYNSVKITSLANFDTTPLGFTTIGGTVQMVKTNDPALVFQGEYSGLINLTAAGDSSLDSCWINFPVTANSTTYIEFDYKTDVPFTLALQAHANGLSTSIYYLAGVNPINHWQKFYLNVQQFAADYPADTYSFYINASLPSGQASGKVLLDNIQLVTFK